MRLFFSPVSSPMIRMARMLALVAMLNFAGAHWIVLQSIAWSGMLVTEAQHSRLAEAVQKTFDGAHPCQLCKGISRAQQNEKKPAVPFQLGKLPLLHERCELSLIAPQGQIKTDEWAELLPLRPHRPEYPPPRLSLT